MALIKVIVNTLAGADPEIDISDDVLMLHPGDRLLFFADNEKDVLVDLNGNAFDSSLVALVRWTGDPAFEALPDEDDYIIVKLPDLEGEPRGYEPRTFRDAVTDFQVNPNVTPLTVTAPDVDKLYPWDKLVFTTPRPSVSSPSKKILVNFGSDEEKSSLIASVREIRPAEFETEALSDGRSVVRLKKLVSGLNGPSPDWPW